MTNTDWLARYAAPAPFLRDSTVLRVGEFAFATDQRCVLAVKGEGGTPMTRGGACTSSCACTCGAAVMARPANRPSTAASAARRTGMVGMAGTIERDCVVITTSPDVAAVAAYG